jgi:hypothetical protein
MGSRCQNSSNELLVELFGLQEVSLIPWDLVAKIQANINVTHEFEETEISHSPFAVDLNSIDRSQLEVNRYQPNKYSSKTRWRVRRRSSEGSSVPGANTGARSKGFLP